MPSLFKTLASIKHHLRLRRNKAGDYKFSHWRDVQPVMDIDVPEGRVSEFPNDSDESSDPDSSDDDTSTTSHDEVVEMDDATRSLSKLSISGVQRSLHPVYLRNSSLIAVQPNDELFRVSLRKRKVERDEDEDDRAFIEKSERPAKRQRAALPPQVERRPNPHATSPGHGSVGVPSPPPALPQPEPQNKSGSMSPSSRPMRRDAVSVVRRRYKSEQRARPSPRKTVRADTQPAVSPPSPSRCPTEEVADDDEITELTSKMGGSQLAPTRVEEFVRHPCVQAAVKAAFLRSVVKMENEIRRRDAKPREKRRRDKEARRRRGCCKSGHQLSAVLAAQ
ncbi:hypothetical protein CONPUDRAFT_165351 [Coniophora puteana RWD-64-598 SS2]|uniref:Uncharacterized protein n=1 Tax=Coniophora puteana (strain RWD-64-598) TaxID=741705 RepID=A0A5M3MPS8_CONPW|nr:uncharacterized protein CONPUDRAFT_165351 [Coniophora puteana RWD-64-598 SS2]EIW81133.1 hypothetical protein CONPUDRAFT_165351 [Coniophora puteana RWD-64-598 SS2]